MSQPKLTTGLPKFEEEDPTVTALIQQLKSMLKIGTGSEGSISTTSLCSAAQAQKSVPRRRRTYTREYLMWCSGYEAAQNFPVELGFRMAEFPSIIKPYGNTSMFRHFPTKAEEFFVPRPRFAQNKRKNFVPPKRSSVLDTLPVLQTAQIFTVDPETMMWYPRSRPVEAKEGKSGRGRRRKNNRH